MTDKDEIIKVLKLKCVKDEHHKYYYLDKLEFCCDIDIKPTFCGIEIYEYLKPIKQLAKYYSNAKPNYYEKLYERNEKKSFDRPLYIRDFDYDMDEILLQYIKCFEKSSLLLTWPICNIKDIYGSEFYKELKRNGNVHAIKEISLTKKQVQGIIYQIYYDKSGFKEMNCIKGKQEKSKASNHKNKFFLIFYQPNNFDEISGKDAPLKVKLREILRNCSGESLNTKLNFFLHITDNHTQVVELSQLFCNKNSLRLLQYQRLDRITNKDFQYSSSLVMTFKNWLYQNIHPLDHIRFMLFSSIVLYSLGLRNMNDIDVIIFHSPMKNSKTANFFELIEEFILNKDTRFPFIDASIKREKGWHAGDILSEYLEEWFEKEWPALYNAPSMDDTILNPKFHYYYFGVKIISMQADIERRIKRSRAAAYADLIALITFVDPNIKIPTLPSGYWESHVYYEFTEEKICSLFKKISNYLRYRYNIKMSIDEVKKYIPS